MLQRNKDTTCLSFAMLRLVSPNHSLSMHWLHLLLILETGQAFRADYRSMTLMFISKDLAQHSNLKYTMPMGRIFFQSCSVSIIQTDSSLLHKGFHRSQCLYFYLPCFAGDVLDRCWCLVRSSSQNQREIVRPCLQISNQVHFCVHKYHMA